MANTITAKELMSQKNDFVIIDVRESDEIDGGKIEDSVHMPLGLSIRNAKKKQIEDLRDKKICTYCGTGYRGNIAADELVKEGFNAYFGRWLSFMESILIFFIHSKLVGF